MANYSLPMVLKIKEILDGFKEPDYEFDYDDEEATFTLKSDVSTTGDPVLIQITVQRDEDEDDLLSVLSLLAIDYDSDAEDALETIAAYANENGCQHRDYDCEMFVHETDEGAMNLILRMKHYFDEDICDDENEDEFTELIQNVIGGATTEFALISPLLAALTGGEEEAHKVMQRLQRQVDDAKERVESASVENSIPMEALLDKFMAVKEQAQAGDADAQVEFGKSLQALFGDEENDEDDEDNSPVYWFKKAAKQGHKEARYLVAQCYHEGKGVKKSAKDAREWYKKQIDFDLTEKSEDTNLLKASLNALAELGERAKSTVVFPIKYGKSTFESTDEVIDQINKNPDALGFFSQCTIYGACFLKRGTLGIDGLFEAANAGSVDAILGLGRLYECGYDFLARDIHSAITLYKYAYSLKNADALHSLGYVLFNSMDKKEIGLSMMKKAEELGSKTASIQLELNKDRIEGVSTILFDEIPKKEFEVNELEVADCLQLYAVNLSDENELKSAVLDIMTNMKPETFSVIMNEFRVKYLRRRKLMHFTDRVNFSAVFDALVNEGLVETKNVGDFGVAENTIYSAKASTQKMKSVTLDWDI